MKKEPEKKLPTMRIIIPAQELRYTKPKPEIKRTSGLEPKPEIKRTSGLKSRPELKRTAGLEPKPEIKLTADLEPKSEGTVTADLNQKAEGKPTASSFIAELVFCLLLMVAICALNNIHVLASNVSKLTFADLFSDFGAKMWLNMGVSAAAFLVLRIFLRKPYFAGIFVAFGTFLAVNFDWLVGFFRLFIKTYNPAAIGGIVLYAALVTGFFAFLRFLYKKRFPVHTISKILSATFAGLVLFNIVMAFIAMGGAGDPDKQLAAVTDVVRTDSVQDKPSAATETTADEPTPNTVPEAFGLPNVYFFVLDECGTFDIMSKYYNYDNAVFDQFLRDEGFSVSRESYATDNQTEHCFADLLNLEYISREYTKDECYDAIPDAKLFNIFSDLGYSQYQILNSKYFKGIESLRSGSGQGYEDANMFGDEGEGDVAGGSISDAIFELLEGQTSGSDTKVDTQALNEWMFYPTEYIKNTNEYKQYKKRDYMEHADTLLWVFDYFDSPSAYTASSPRVTYAYMTATHVPFVFNEYGGIISYNDNRNWENTDIYLNQYKFVSKRLMSGISNIIDNDPNSIIIIMSDHGIRYHADCTKKHTFYITDKESCRIMNAVYIKGQQCDIEGLSGINTLRYVLSLYEGLDYPPVEDPITKDSPDDLSGIIPHHR